MTEERRHQTLVGLHETP